MLDPIASSRTRYDDPLREAESVERKPRSPARDESSLLAQLPDPPAGRSANAVDAASPLTAAQVRDANVGARLDALRDSYSGPYKVDGQTVTAPPMFRMNGGANHESAKVHDTELAKIAARVGVDIAGVRGGYGRPQDLVKVTQALIDAGKLPPPPGDVASRIKAMQWEWGIGVDCACYTFRGVEAAHRTSGGSQGLAIVGTENFRNLDGNKSFTKVDPTLARPGDVMTLDATPPETVGHNVIVRSHTMNGPLHTFEVDSAWGAGADGDVKGGYRRDTWTYDETTRLWSWTNHHVSPPVTETSTEGPSERFHGCYRPKVSR